MARLRLFHQRLKLDDARTQTRTGTPLRERDFKRLLGVRTTSDIMSHGGERDSIRTLPTARVRCCRKPPRFPTLAETADQAPTSGDQSPLTLSPPLTEGRATCLALARALTPERYLHANGTDGAQRLYG